MRLKKFFIFTCFGMVLFSPGISHPASAAHLPQLSRETTQRADHLFLVHGIKNLRLYWADAASRLIER